MAGADLHDEEMADAPAARSRIRSTVTQVNKKGRGHERDAMELEDDRKGAYDGLDTSRSGPQMSVEGWVIFASNLHEETSEEEIVEAFSEFGHVKNAYLNLDRRTGFAKGYILIEYGKRDEAQQAINGMNGAEFLEQRLKVTWCFTPGPVKRSSGRRR